MATTNLMTEITSRYSKMTKAEKKVADFVLSSPQTALSSTITDLSKLCDVGETSVFRFCRTLSLKGYQDFKLSLALSTSTPESLAKKELIDVADTDNCKDTATKVLQAYNMALNQAFETLNFNAIPKVVDLILSARSINMFGFGGSGTSASEAPRGVPLRSAAAPSACRPVQQTALSKSKRPLRVRPLPLCGIPLPYPKPPHCISSGRNVRGRFPRPARSAPRGLRTQT